MATQYEPIVKDSTLNTTESTPRNLADVLASGLTNIANNVKPDGGDISISVPGMSANNVNDGFSELKQSLTDLGFGTPQVINNIVANFEYTVPSYGMITGYWRTASASYSIVGVMSNKLGTSQYRLLQSRTSAGEYSDINIVVVKGEKLTFANWGNVGDYKIYFVPFTS